MTEKKYYLTVYRVEILSGDPIPAMAPLSDVMVQAMEGRYSMRTQQTEEEILNVSAAYKILCDHGNDPTRFSVMSPDLEDTDDEEGR